MENEISFFHEFTGQHLTEDEKINGKKEVTVLFEDEINEIFIDGFKYDLDTGLAWELGNPYDVVKQELRERGEL